MDRDKIFGFVGEKKATELLQAKGYTVYCVNYRTAVGEIDIVAKDGDTLVFVEVKSRHSREYGLPSEAVAFYKRRKIVRIAQVYLAQHGLWQSPCRFDVVEILKRAGRPVAVRHIIHAFTAE